MANDMYAPGRENFWNGNIDFTTDTINWILVDAADYTRNLATHNAYDDITVAGRVGTETALTSKTVGTVSAGTIDAANSTMSSVTGDPTEEVVMWMDSGGAESTQLLMINWDTSVSATPNGGDITAQWNASGIATWS